MATDLAAAKGIPVLHLDRIAWRPGWRPRDIGDFLADLDAFLAKPGWVIDGNHPLGFERRARLADIAVVVEVPTAVCIWRLLRRRVRYARRTRPSMADGCAERLRLRFLWHVIRYRSRTLPGLFADLAQAAPELEVVLVGGSHFRSRNHTRGSLTHVARSLP